MEASPLECRGHSRWRSPRIVFFMASLLLGLTFGEGGVEQPTGGLEAHLLLDEPCRFGGAVFAVHAGIFPLDGKGTVVADVVQRPRDLLEVDLASTGRAEVPAPTRIAEIEVRGEDAGPAVEGPGGVLDVHVIDPVGE